jgi:hypothetical protein
MASNAHIDTVLKELVETANYLRETGRLMRAAVDHLIAVEEHFEKSNRYLILVAEHADKAINAALRAQERAEDASGDAGGQ